MKFMTKAAAIVLASALALTGCSGEKKGATEGTNTSKGGELSGTVNFGVWGDGATAKEVAKAFQAKHPKVTVNVQAAPWGQYWTKLQTAATGGNAPDVFLMTTSNFPLYANNKQLMPIEDQGEQAKYADTKAYPEALAKSYEWDGKQYGYPKDIDTIAVYYNKKLFKEAGVPDPTSQWTWEQMADAAKKISDKNKGKNIFGIAAALWDQGNQMPTILANGGYTISQDMKSVGFDKPETIKGMQMWVDLLKNGSSPTMKQMTDTHSSDWFKSGKVAIMWDGPWSVADYGQAPALKGNLGVVEVPTVNGKKVSMSNGLAPVVYAKSKNKDAAAAFASFVAGAESQKIWAKEVIPSLPDAQSAWTDQMKQYGVDTQPFLNAIKYSQTMPRSLNSEAWSTPNYDVTVKIWDGSLSVEEGMKQCQKITEDALAKEK